MLKIHSNAYFRLFIPAIYASVFFPAFSQRAWSQPIPAKVDLPCHSDWKRVLVYAPTPDVDVSSLEAKQKQQFINDGYSPDQAENAASSLSSSFLMASKGIIQNSKLEFTRRKNVILCKITAQAPLFKEGKADYKSTLIINYSDRKNFIALDSTNLTRYPTDAQLSRDPFQELQNVGRDYAASVYLSLEPWEKFFSVKEGDKSLTSDNTFEAVHKLDSDPPTIYKATIDKKLNVPLKIEAFYEGKTAKPFKVYQAKEFKLLKEGLYVPQSVSIGVVDESGQSVWKADYELVSLDLGQSVDLTVLNTHTILPKGTMVADSRFGADKMVSYRVRKGGFPDDATVLKLVERIEEGKRAEKSRPKMNITRNFAVPIGALLLIGGLVWFRRSRRV